MRRPKCTARPSLPVSILALSSLVASAQAADDVFALGKITVNATRLQSASDDVVTKDEIWDFNANTLDQAVKLIPGVIGTLDSNGRRNEHDILIRGFGRWQAPISIDGIRIYLPADNRLDFNRFLTQDLAQIQVQKGYVSVLDGPGGMGGAINLVTRKPTKSFEGEFQSGAFFDNHAAYSGWNGYAMVGTRQDDYYLQASGSYLDRDHWRLSDDFRPAASAIEDGSRRNGSANRDWRINVKAGFTPNDTDEYSLSYTSQSGSKWAPLNVYNDPPDPPNSFWRWPWWDVDSLYWLSNTRIGDHAYLKTRLFYNTFDNALYAYDDQTYTTQSRNGRFRSIYADEGYGGSVEFGMPWLSRNTLKAALHYRTDKHTERNYNRPTDPAASSVEPLQRSREHTASLALENTYHAAADVDLVLGLSYDKNDLRLAQEFDAATGLFEYPTGGSNAVNAQGAIHWRYTEAAKLHASISSRTRFPTLFERFSTRFGNALPNPSLDPERSTNYELGWEGSPRPDTNLSAAVFYNDVQDIIQTVVVTTAPTQITQTQNVGNGEFYGLELAADSQLGDKWRIGANYSWLKRKIVDPLQPDFKPVGTPTHQAFVFVSYRPIDSLTIIPSLEFADARWSDVTGGAYRRTGEYTMVDLQLQYSGGQFGNGSSWQAAIGGSNLLDENFELAHGFPEPGRSFYAKLKLMF